MPGTGATERILLVEDDPVLRKLLSSSLTTRGFTVQEADSRKRALAALAKYNDIAVVIADLGLPPLPHATAEGLAVIREVSLAAPQTKIIVLTGQDEEQAALEAIREGAFDFLAKPADTDEIHKALDRALLFYRKEQDMAASGLARLQLNTKVAGGLKAVREEAEEKLIRQVLKETDFNVYQSAAKLGVKRESIYYFIKKFAINRDDH